MTNEAKIRESWNRESLNREPANEADSTVQRFNGSTIHRLAMLCAVAVFLILGSPLSSLAGDNFSNSPRPDFWDTDGTINAVLATNGTVYVGGSFSYVAPKGRKIAAIDSYTATLDSEFPFMPGASVSAIVEDGNGGWFIGGSFSEVAGLPRTNLVHVRSDNSVDPQFHPNPDAPVRTLALDNQILFVGGEFDHINGQSRTRLAAISISGAEGALLSWAPVANGGVSNLLVAGDTIYVGGLFAMMGGDARNNIAALDRTSGMATAWNPNANGVVQTMALLEDRLYVGGFFTTIGGAGRYGLAALDIHQNVLNATAWDPNPNGKVTVLRATCDTIYVGGYFSQIAGQSRVRVAAIDAHSGAVSAWRPRLEAMYSTTLASSVLALELSGDRVYLGGEFSIGGAQPRRDLAAVDAATGVPLAWNPNVNGGVNALAVGGRSVVAGFLNSPGGVERQNLAAFDEVTGRATEWNPSASGPIFALAAGSNLVYAAGSFTNAGGLTRNGVAAINAVSGQVLANWDANVNGTVYALAFANDILYLGGNFNTVSGLNRLGLAAVDGATGQPLANWIAQVVNGSVRALALAGNTLYVGGSFTIISSSFRSRIAALNATSALLQNWNPGASNTVSALAVSDTAVYAGGSFDMISGTPRAFIAALDPASALAMSWNPGADGEVEALALYAATVYVGGNFQTVSGQTRLGCAAVALDGSLQDWNPGRYYENHPLALAVSERAVYVGGSDLRFDGSPSTHALGAFARVGAPTLTVAPTNQNVLVGGDATFTVEVVGEEPIFYQWRFNGINLPSQTNAVFHQTNVQVGDSGTYQVIVTNALGSITAQATLMVLSPVVINNQPVSQSLSNGVTSATLAVVASGSPAPIYQWRLNGANIPGAVFSTLTLSNLTPTSGGSYYVAVGNRLGAVNSDVAEVVVSNPALSFADDFQDRGTISGLFGVGRGSNVIATAQINEPNHAGKTGGKSVWLSWTAPANGIATFSTRGSGFDTLLGIYTNAALMGEVTSDDDRDGFFTSLATFNAVIGVEYLIAVDGLAGASGNIVLSWNLDTSTTDFPRIISQPFSQTVAPGGTASFEVAANSPTLMTFQWFFGCQAISGATNSLLVISNVQTRHVGAYHVVIMNSSTRVAESLPAALEMGPNSDAFSFDKLEDLVGNSTVLAKANAQLAAAANGGGGAILVSMGSIVSQTFDTTGYRSGFRETNHCGIIGGASAWLRFQPTQDGTVLVDTIGSAFDTILAVYRDTNILVLQTNLAAARVECDNNNAPDGVRSLLTFPASGGTYYLAVVDGVNGATGPCAVHWQLGSAPTPITTMANISQRAGRTVTLSAGVSSTVSAVSYQWRLNGTNLVGATGSTLTLTNLAADQGGTYSVIASNFAGVFTNICAALSVDPPLHLANMAWLTNRQFVCQVKGRTGDLFALQASTNLTRWQTLVSEQLISDSWAFTDTSAHLFNHRFYRVIPFVALEPSLIWTNGTPHLRLSSASSEPCIVQTTTNWLVWDPIYTNAALNTPLLFVEPLTNSVRRFYRAKLLP